MASRIRRAALIATASEPGRELAGAVRDLTWRKEFSLDVLPKPAPSDVARAIERYDVVILDATAEPAGGSNYAGFTSQPQAMNHVLVVSRTPLPLNFHGLREGGAPPYPGTFSNDNLLSWLDAQLEELRESPSRSCRERMLTMVRAAPPGRGPGRQVFVSYRREAVNEARELAARLNSGEVPEAAGVPLTATFLEPGEIAFDDEILTSRLRWYCVSLLAERLRSCDRLWICDSPDYFTSWWTRAELVLCRYLEAVGGSQRHIGIWRYDPASGRSSAADGIVPALTEDQCRRLGRLLSGTVHLSGRLGEVPLPRRSSFWDDDVFTSDFADVPLLAVTASHGTGSPLTTEDVDAVLYAREEEFMVVPPDVLAAAIPGHPAEFSGFSISREPLPRYLFSPGDLSPRAPRWYAARAGRRTAPLGGIGGSLEPLPVFRAGRIEH